MERSSLHQRISTTKQALFDEGILDKQFVQLEKLEEKGNPNFVEDTITIFFRESTKLLAAVEEAMDKTPIDYMKLDKCLYQLKGSSASIGAIKVKNEVNQTRDYCSQGNMEAARASFQRLRNENQILRAKLDSYFQLVAQDPTRN